MFFRKIKLTAAGKAQIVKAVTGNERIRFTRIVMGNGAAQDAESATGLNNQTAEAEFAEITVNYGTAVLTARYDNGDLQTGFYATELGIMAVGQDEAEFMYAYATTENASYIPATDEAPGTNYEITVAVAVGEAENVEAVIGEAGGYARKQELKEHIEDQNNPHNVTAKDVGLENVQNVSPNMMQVTYQKAKTLEGLQSGELMMNAMGKMAKAVDELQSIIEKLKTVTVTKDVESGTITFRAKEYISSQLTLPEIKGYKPAAIAGWQIAAAQVAGSHDEDIDPNNMSISGNTLYFHLVNRRDTVNYGRMWFRVLYVRTMEDEE